MTREQMFRYMDDPSLLNERTLGELKEILEEYPYFQTAHLLYARSLMNESNFRFSNQLKTCAVYATDRSVLYQLLHPKSEKHLHERSPEVEVKVKGQEPAVTFELSDDAPITETYLITTEEKTDSTREKSSFDLLNFEPGEMGYKLEGIEAENEKPLSELAKELQRLAVRKENALQNPPREDLIDRFIRENPIIQPRSTALKQRDEMTDPEDEHKDTDEFITETLARIYLKQGFYQKAIKAFQRLSLKYPEKSVYFAGQIEEITKLLNK